MAPSRLSYLSLLLSGGALPVAGYAAWDMRTTARETRRIAVEDPAEDLLSARLAELEQSLEVLERSTLDRGTTRREALQQSLRETNAQTDRLTELADRVERLEHGQRPDLAHIDGPREAQGDSALAKLEEELRHTSIEEALARYRAQFLDPAVDDLMRLETLRMLHLFPEEYDPVDTAVVDATLRLAQRSPTEKTRDRAISMLRDTTDERVVDPLLQVLASDPSPTVRGRAARILGGFLQLDRVDRSLRTALGVETDPNAQAHIRAALGLVRKGKN